ncbi:hypothetical protein AJ88_29520 [Mesorhizobium amorphae CCBAU 01583]|nr:hypothetical protein AJ88_29520 [Mesorhizobium amorphae CCBAU 01583]
MLSLLPSPQTTSHSITLAGRKLDYQSKAGTLSLLSGKGAGRKLDYQSKAGTLSLLSGKGDVTAEIFYVAYTLRPPDNAAKQPQRPITFVFNGGPGAASAYLHLGALGPRVIATGTNGEFLPSPQDSSTIRTVGST